MPNKKFYSIIRNAAKNGAGVIVVSSELDELIELSDRIIMINNGQIVGEKPRSHLMIRKFIGDFVVILGKGEKH